MIRKSRMILRSPAFKKYSVIRKGTVLNDLIGVFHSSTGWLALSLPTEHLPTTEKHSFASAALSDGVLKTLFLWPD